MTKLFVGGINDSFNEEEIKGYFGKFGEVKDLVLVKDRVSGNARGFGFVEFVDPNSAKKALDEPVHKIGERNVDVKIARPKGENGANYQSPQHQYVNNRPNYNNVSSFFYTENPTKSKKIFVGGLSSSITEDEFKSYFEGFGKTTDVVIMYDNTTHRPRGFGFITFDSSDAVDSVLRKKYHELNSKAVEVKVAVPKDSSYHTHYPYSKLNGGRGYGFYPNYPPPSPRFLYYPPPIPPYYNGGYGLGPCIPFVRSPWGPGMMIAGRGPPMYTNSPVYFSYYNGENGRYTTDSTHSRSTEGAGIEKLDVQQES